MISFRKEYTLIIAATGGNKIAKIDKRISPKRSTMVNIYNDEQQKRN
jgi:hypothetical protein